MSREHEVRRRTAPRACMPAASTIASVLAVWLLVLAAPRGAAAQDASGQRAAEWWAGAEPDHAPSAGDPSALPPPAPSDEPTGLDPELSPRPRPQRYDPTPAHVLMALGGLAVLAGIVVASIGALVEHPPFGSLCWGTCSPPPSAMPYFVSAAITGGAGLVSLVVGVALLTSLPSRARSASVAFSIAPLERGAMFVAGGRF